MAPITRDPTKHGDGRERRPLSDRLYAEISRLIVSGELQRQEPNGSLVTHADLSHLDAAWNQIVGDGRVTPTSTRLAST